jgi:hypothetical protein
MTAPAGKPHRGSASPEEHRRNLAEAAEAGKRLAEHSMTERQRRALVRAFQAPLLPPNRTRRWQKKKLTRACQDYEKGLRGVALYAAHIVGWSRLSHDSRMVRSQRLLKSIRRRQSRAKRVATKPAIMPATKPGE